MNDAEAEDEDAVEEAEALLDTLRDGLKTGNQQSGGLGWTSVSLRRDRSVTLSPDLKNPVKGLQMDPSLYPPTVPIQLDRLELTDCPQT